jgi:ParB-like chromosome segregation protein Spo0J
MKPNIRKIVDAYEAATADLSESEAVQLQNDLKAYLHGKLLDGANPVGLVLWVPVEKVEANSYNPNAVAKKEMGLLYVSIKHDGFTQPVVTVYDEEQDKYIIVDGFHRYYVCKTCPDILERNHGYLPVVVIDKPISDRMASTVRHNRARGAHSIDGMSNIVFNMLNEGLSDSDICNELGMEAEELLKLKYITGFAKLYEDVEFSKAWKTKSMIMIERRRRSAAQDNDTRHNDKQP